MTAVIDRTLAHEPTLVSKLKKEHITSYLEALEACGANYVEIDRRMLPVLEGEDLSQKYIFRIENEDDIEFCRYRRFAYVSLPYSMSRFFRRLSTNQNVLAEVFADEYSAQAVLLGLKSSRFLKYISVIRLTGFFSPDTAPMKRLVEWFRENFIQSIDICPLNKALSGCVGAIGAKDAGADAITMTFGQELPYTSLESFYIDMHILSRTFIPKEIISGICHASTAYMNIFGALPCGLDHLDELVDRLKTPVCDPERGVVYRTFAVRRRENEEKKPHESAVKRRIESMEFESELEKAVIEAVLKAGLLY